MTLATAMEAPKLRPTSEDRVRAALWFAERGFGVFPCWSTSATGRCRCPRGGNCTSPGKHPITPDGFHDATTDVNKIRTFLSAASEPNYGLLPPDGVFVWDVDTDEERAGIMRQAIVSGPLPPTLHDTTAHGEHIFWRWPDSLPRPLRRMFGLVTRWGTGAGAGYVIGPRSVHASGFEYTPAEDTVFEIATLPETWARAAIAGESDSIRIGGRPEPSDVPVGGRHDFLRDTARHYAGTVRDPDALFAAVWAANEKLSQPKTVDEVRRAIGDVLTRYAADPVEEDPDTGEVRRVAVEELPLLGRPETGDFPADPDPVTFSGLLGECTEVIAEGTDASRVGLLGALVAFCGALVPGSAYFHRMQTSSPFIALVGESSIGRKGTAMLRAQDAMSDTFGAVDVSRVILDGIASGEGLINTLAWKQTTFTREPTAGLVFEEEYASLISARGREGSTLDPKMRAAFDGGPLSNRKSNETKSVAPPYWLPALIAITPDELRERLEPGALRSGSANRWVYLPVVRRELIPNNTAPRLTNEQQTDLTDARRLSLERRDPLSVAPGVTSRLAEYADFLPTVSSGTSLDLVRRLPVIAFRIALVHAVCERASSVTTEHLERALGITEYARSGLPWVFGGSTSNPDADLLLRHLQAAGRLRQHSITRSLIRDPLRRQRAIDEIERLGYGKVEMTATGNSRPVAELVLTPVARGFVQFVPVRPTVRPTISGQKAADHIGLDELDKPPLLSVNRLDKPWTNHGQTDDRSGSVQFVHASTAPQAENAQTMDELDKPPLLSVNRLDKPWTNHGQTMDKPGQTDATDTVVIGSEWANPCRDYARHRSYHRRADSGWVCDRCEEGS